MIHYFISDTSDERFYSIGLEAWKEDKDVLFSNTGKKGSTFSLLERIRLFSAVGPQRQTTSFTVEFGKDSAVGHSSQTSKELIQSIGASTFYPKESAPQEEYLKLRDKVFEIYNRSSCMDFQTVKQEGN